MRMLAFNETAREQASKCRRSKKRYARVFVAPSGVLARLSPLGDFSVAAFSKNARI
jgi:hypothetical protein